MALSKGLKHRVIGKKGDVEKNFSTPCCRPAPKNKESPQSVDLLKKRADVTK